LPTSLDSMLPQIGASGQTSEGNKRRSPSGQSKCLARFRPEVHFDKALVDQGDVSRDLCLGHTSTDPPPPTIVDFPQALNTCLVAQGRRPAKSPPFSMTPHCHGLARPQAHPADNSVPGIVFSRSRRCPRIAGHL
jgi:hypothetical protein